MNTKKKSLLVFLFTGLVLFLMLKDDLEVSLKILTNANLYYILLAIIVYFLGFTVEVIALKKLVNQYNKNYKFKRAFKLNLITKFFNGITPLASGGQPFQVYELTKDKISVAHGTNIIVENFILYQSALVILGLFACFFSPVHPTHLVKLLLIIGILLNLLLLAFAYIVGINKKMNKKIVLGVAKILSKTKIIKNKKETLKNLSDTCNDFYEGFKNLSKNKKLIIEGIILQFIALVINFSIPFILFKGLNIDVDITIINCIILSTLVFLAGSFIPIPGGTGGMEFAFIGFFKHFTLTKYLKSLTISWRFITYIMPVILGAIAFNIGGKKNHN